MQSPTDSLVFEGSGAGFAATNLIVLKDATLVDCVRIRVTA
jgi:hypothetical protein